ncbi:MAG: prolyl oligopeptidase family serine peptidase [Bacteroidetes bacterium]|nr:prolyl oligopeptidase family serine peptidase [Bacteroidota bacterium]
MKRLIFNVLYAFILLLVPAEIFCNNLLQDSSPQFPGKKSEWKGFVRYDFEFNGRQCRIVCPGKPAEGNPWIWNARFPDWHTDIDSILLSEGFYVTNINTDEFNGSPEGVKVWDEYFRYLTKSFGFENRVALEGISRGGLYVYNFAKKYPWRISCIYAEAPVCDIKSWPGGFGKGPGSLQDWQLVMKAYNFKDENEAKAYADNPVDNLEKLAAAKVPVLHMIGLNDSIVPPEENSFILINRYVRLGGVATVVPCTRGKQDLSGHHFDIETPALVADFVKTNTRAFRKILSPGDFHLYRGGLSRSAAKFEKERTGRVAFLGGSITYNNGWRDSVSNAIRKRFPETKFEFINAGIPSLGSLPDAFRFEQDVLSKGRPDLLFVEAAVNDRTNEYPGIEQVRSMEGIVRHALSVNPQTDIVFMYFVDPDKIIDYNKGIIPAEIKNHESVAAHYNIPSVNLANEVTQRINNMEFTWEGDFIDLHPSPFGQQVYYRSISALLMKCWSPGLIPNSSDLPLPAMLDPYSYENGRLVNVDKKYVTEGWTFVENWTPDDKASTREGYVNVPMLVGNKPGEILKFSFKGTAAGIAVAAGPDAGFIEYSIDGKEWKSLDLFTQWSGGLHLPWFLTLADGLKKGSHTLRIRLSNDRNEASKGTVCRIRYFYVN